MKQTDQVRKRTDETVSTGSCIKPCSLCGGIYHNIAFHGGYVCEDCVAYLKEKT